MHSYISYLRILYLCAALVYFYGQMIGAANPSDGGNITYCIPWTNGHVDLTEKENATIITKLSPDEKLKNRNNLFCSWAIYSPEDTRSYVKITDFKMPSVTDREDCHDNYDQGSIAVKQDDIQDSYNWLSAPPGDYIRICGNGIVPPEFSSKDNYIHIEFSGAKKKQEVEVKFTAYKFGAESCPPGWSQYSDMCYKLFQNKETFNTAQKFCTILQANIASVESNDEANFLADLISNTEEMHADDFVWLGLIKGPKNKAVNWIDHANATYDYTSKWSSMEGSNSIQDEKDYNECLAVTQNGKWAFKPCHSSLDNYAYICKSNKDGLTKLYSAPASRFVTIVGEVKEETLNKGSHLNVCHFIILATCILNLLLRR